jgi:hypothetical protein
MPMFQTQIDAEAGAASNGGRRPTVVAAPASASPELSGPPSIPMVDGHDVRGRVNFGSWSGAPILLDAQTRL